MDIELDDLERALVPRRGAESEMKLVWTEHWIKEVLVTRVCSTYQGRRRKLNQRILVAWSEGEPRRGIF